ncbi:DUF72 domain-containing protein [Chryseosolibacter indicus]|uniref:DUF72 domain-containing protein n=1 Tax=Chryseosolibacter indicus TaxID=2782351 RepID=A0ABS5VQQ1_9BACT|nr:DUF72 domain-containing protein [Chryseosolibacter indicus]MBT1703768.1 DUF72 domain-containing protein [Chryseosolibacter indicus]
MQGIQNFYSGLSGIALPNPKYQYPTEFQKSSRLTYYNSLFNSIEVNSTFYKIPRSATLERWASSVGDNFKFTFKLFKEITHTKNLMFDAVHIEQFIRTISHAGKKRACLLVQFPPSLKKESIRQVDHLLDKIKLNDADNLWNIVVEFRDKSWYHNDVYEMLSFYNVTLVIHDIPKSATPVKTTSSDVIYIRFHGPTGNYGGSYTDAFLLEYAEYVRGWLNEEKKVFVYFNNTKGDAFKNLNTFNKYLSELTSDVNMY